MGDHTLKLTVNGERRDVAATTVLGLLEELGLNPLATVVEHNAHIVARAPILKRFWRTAIFWN